MTTRVMRISGMFDICDASRGLQMPSGSLTAAVGLILRSKLVFLISVRRDVDTVREFEAVSDHLPSGWALIMRAIK